MDYYQGVVADYLSADPAMFVKPECCIRLGSEGQLKKGNHWYCDIVAINMRTETAYLCEVTYSQTLAALVKRLRSWDANWPALRSALVHDNHVPDDWRVRPWVFVPGDLESKAVDKLSEFSSPCDDGERMPQPRLTTLEKVAPWLYPAPHGHPELVFDE